MRSLSASLILSISLLLAGCANVVVVRPGTVVRLTRPVRAYFGTFDHRAPDGTPVYVEQGQGEFPAGTYLVPPSTQPSK